MGSSRNDVLILGLGNPLMGDDGVGIAVIAELQRMKWPEGVAVLDGGSSALSCLDQIGCSVNLIAVDAVTMGRRPGSVYRLTLKDQGSGEAGPTAESGSGWSGQGSHGLPLTTVVSLARSMTGLPVEVVVFGVEPASLGFTTELSEAVNAAVPRVVREVRHEVGRTVKGLPSS